MHNLSNVVFCLSIHNNPYICFSKNLLTFNALTLYYFYMKRTPKKAKNSKIEHLF